MIKKNYFETNLFKNEIYSGIYKLVLFPSSILQQLEVMQPESNFILGLTPTSKRSAKKDNRNKIGAENKAS